MTETYEERQERWAEAAARQEQYRRSAEAIVKREARIAAGLCVVDDGRCVTHDVKADLGHDIDINGYTRADGTARDD